MSFEERNTVTYLFISLLIAALFGSKIWAGTVAGAFDGPEGLQTWARTVLWYIPFAIAITIGGVIATNIVYGIVTGDRDMRMQEDERDKFIGLRGIRVTATVFSMSWIGAVIALATGTTALGALNIMLAAGWASDFIGNIVKFYHYRRGY